MSNTTITQIDWGNVIAGDEVFEPGQLTFAAEDTVLSGTILARDSVTKNWVPFVVGGTTNENGIPKGILTYEVSATAAVDVAIRAMVHGKVKTERLIIHADEDGSNVDADVLDQLRVYGITAENIKQLGRQET